MRRAFLAGKDPLNLTLEIKGEEKKGRDKGGCCIGEDIREKGRGKSETKEGVWTDLYKTPERYHLKTSVSPAQNHINLNKMAGKEKLEFQPMRTPNH